ncbi:hypothetical protein [Amycolatopsis sp. NPDC051371]|uniref:hypothetical protein n=1 Tax=Amycolatopsis sp. NPDC051371 TaxID=3155800 RepID=UPI003416B5A1
MTEQPSDNVVDIEAARRAAEQSKATHAAESREAKEARRAAEREAAREAVAGIGAEYAGWLDGQRAGLPEDLRQVPGWSYRFARAYGAPWIDVTSASATEDGVRQFFATSSPHPSGINGDLFVFGGRLVAYQPTGGHLSSERVLTQVTPGLAARLLLERAVTVKLAELSEEALFDPAIVAQVVSDPDFVRWNSPTGEPGTTYWKRAVPSPAMVQPYLESPALPGVRTLRELVRRPAVDWAGRDVAVNGYDPASGLLVDVPADEVALHPALTDAPVPAAQVQDAACRLWGLFESFTWKGQADYANWLAAAVTAVGRRAFAQNPGRFLPVPGLLITAGAPDSGKSTLTDVIARLYGAAEVRYTGDDDEFRKAILGAVATHPDAKVVTLNNVPNGTRLRGAPLDALITDPVISGRELGKTRSLSFANTAQVVANGNRLSLGDDSVTRFIVTELDPPTTAQKAAPRAVADMPSAVQLPEFQAGVLALLRTMVIGWTQAGRPEGDAKAIRGTFAEWARKVAGLLDLAGVPGFLDNLDVMRDRDTDPDAEFVSALWRVFGADDFTAKDVLARCREGEGAAAGLAMGGRDPARTEALADLADTVPKPRYGGLLNAQSVGIALRRVLDKPARVGERREVLLGAATSARNQKVWRLSARDV